jgi:hypothetical protein
MMQKAVRRLAEASALTGGLVLLALVVLSTLSIAGRGLNDLLHTDFAETYLAGVSAFLLDLGVGEVSGSYELLEAGIAFAIFSFFPICHIHSGHATVDIFTSRLSARATRWIMAFWEVALAATLVLVTVQLFGGVQRYYGNGETTLFLQFPLWWAYAASFSAAVIACIVGIYCAAARLLEASTQRKVLPAD